ncbi:MAG: peptide deformylase [Bacteroidetes bacterium]|nr:MAG: peptide deformylase [Bacteroidota bacterium]
MILPIVAYGHKALRAENKEIEELTPEIKTLIDNMFETMYQASGVGLAAPQVNQNLRLFIVDGSPFAEDMEDEKDMEQLRNFKKVFINPVIEEEFGDDWSFEEGCLSIPQIREDVVRPEKLRITYRDENFNEKTEEYSGIAARIIQHEYDHIEGILFIDHLSGMKKRLLKRKLQNIAEGKIRVGYKMIFPKLSKKP